MHMPKLSLCCGRRANLVVDNVMFGIEYLKEKIQRELDELIDEEEKKKQEVCTNM